MKHVIALALLLVSGYALGACPAYLQGEYRRLHSTENVDLCALTAGKPVLVVNTASHCGFTPQFEALEAVHQQYRERGLVVLGFSSNDFRQEAASEEKAATICYENFGVTFTMLAPTQVRGAQANALFQELARQTEAPGWNFNKYLLDRDGKVIRHFNSRVKPDSARVRTEIESLL